MKAKKTLKRLNKVAALLSNVIDRLPGSNDDLRVLLDSAKDNVVQAAKKVRAQPSSSVTKRKQPAKAGTVREGRPAGRKKTSLATKNGWETARRKGVSVVTGRRLSKTA